VRLPRPVLVACLLALPAGALPASAQDVPPAAPPRMAAGIADHFHGPGAFVRAACSATCEIKSTLTITYRMRLFLRLKSKTVATGKGHLDAAGSIDVLVGLSNKAIRAVRKRHGDQLPVRLQATATDSDGRKSKISRKLKIPL
jgi:hypothetical protein